MDHNVVPVYKMEITGKGVTVAVVDDGVIHDHPDLEGNFVSKFSFHLFMNNIALLVDIPNNFISNEILLS